MKRPTIRDLADAAGVSVATVNRVLAGAANVRGPTRLLVQDAAARIGFYGLGAIQSRVAASRPRARLGVLLLQPHRPFYQIVASALRRAAADCAEAEVDLRVEFLDDLAPQNTAGRLRAMARDCQAVALTSAVHPIVTEAVAEAQARGVHVFAFIAQLSATGEVPYVGLDNWKHGRTAAWAFAHLCRAPGKIGILVGNPRFRNQEMSETGFRSYFREHAPEFRLLEPLPTFEAAAVAQEMTEGLFRDHPDLAGLYVNGGGITGALAALAATEKRPVVVGYELMDVTRAGLLDGRMTLVMSHPVDRMARALVSGMIMAVAGGASGNLTRIVPFDLFTRENI